MALTVATYCVVPTRATMLLRYIYPLSLLAYWYSRHLTSFASSSPDLDHLFAAADQAIFGCQPSLVFHSVMPSRSYGANSSHLGYFSYYPMIALTVLVPLFVDRPRFGRTAFVVLTSFFLYYLIYLFLPVAGPQYYFRAIGVDAAMQETSHTSANISAHTRKCYHHQAPMVSSANWWNRRRRAANGQQRGLPIVARRHQHGAHDDSLERQPPQTLARHAAAIRVAVRRRGVS